MKSIVLFTLAALVAPVYSQAPAVLETGVMLNAGDLLPPDQLRGPSYRVRDQVVTDGFMAHIDIDSDFGTFRAIGVPQAKRRIAECEAIRKLVETSKGDLFAEGLRRSVEQPVAAVKNIVKNPVESVKQAPRTAGHFFSKVGSAVSRGVNQSQERDSAPSPAEAGAGIGNAAKNVAGFDKAKLDTARQLGVDPYSDNTRLQEEMEKVTWAFFAGGLPLRVGAAAISGGASMALTATNMVGIPEDTYALTQSELALRDERALAAMGVRTTDIEAFQIQPALSTTRRHRIVNYLSALPKAAGRGSMISLANSCQTAEQAEILVGALAILVEGQRGGTVEYTGLKVLGRLPGATTAKGELHVPAPVDYVTWTDEVAGFAGREDLGEGSKVLLHTGRLSPAAAKGLEATGWLPVAVAYPR